MIKSLAALALVSAASASQVEALRFLQGFSGAEEPLTAPEDCIADGLELYSDATVVVQDVEAGDYAHLQEAIAALKDMWSTVKRVPHDCLNKGTTLPQQTELTGIDFVAGKSFKVNGSELFGDISAAGKYLEKGQYEAFGA